ncbi:MAG TPA: NAD-dependent epimerase/dehydratase family protein [Thermoanaerobaculia bacterium]
MRIFLTGATGYIGNAVALTLRKHGHDVDALVRPESETRSLRDAGVVLIAGDLSTLPSLEFTEYDGVVHTAVAKKNAVALDRSAVDVFTKSGRPFLYTSGVWILGNTTNANESTRVNPLPIVAWRPAHEQLVLDSGGAALRPGCVYGGKQSMFADWFASVEQGGPIRIAGDGKNRWALVGLDDLAGCYLRAIEQGATGVLHATDDTHASLNDCARALSKDAKIEHLPVDRAKLGPFADALLVDQVISSDATRRKLGWMPKQTFASAARKLDQ